jgi:PAS domain S-box-containing protein
MNRFLVTADDMGAPTAHVPLPMLHSLTKLFPAEKIVLTYHQQTDHVRVTFPGRDPPAVQTILDDLHSTVSPPQRFAKWPGLHVPAAQPPKPNETSESGCNEPPHPQSGTETTGGVLTKLRSAMSTLNALQQDCMAALIFDLMASVAVERHCFAKLFEASPDGYVATDFDGTVQHANKSMYQLLQIDPPHLNGKPLLMFFTPHSKALIQQRLRLLRTGISENQPYTDVQAQLMQRDDERLAVSLRVIAIKSQDSAHSTIRWLIRNES